MKYLIEIDEEVGMIKTKDEAGAICFYPITKANISRFGDFYREEVDKDKDELECKKHEEDSRSEYLSYWVPKF